MSDALGEMKKQVLGRHWAMMLSGAIGALVGIYILIEAYFLKESPFCAQISWLGCGLAEALLGMPWLRPLNALLGICAFSYFILCGRRLPGLGPELVRFRRGMLIMANACLGYALLLRALELVMANQFCLSCAMMFACLVVIAVASWIEWAQLQTGRERTFVARHFYANMLKLCIVFIVISFGGVSASLGMMPRPVRETDRRFSWAGFVRDPNEVMRLSRRNKINHLLLLYEGNCLQSYRYSLIFLDPEVKGLIEEYPKVMFDVSMELYLPLLDQYEIEGAPSIMIVNPQREVIGKLVGEKSKEEFIEAFSQLSVEGDDQATSSPGF